MDHVEVAIVLRAGPAGIPLILGRVHDDGLLRDALRKAIAAAEQRVRRYAHRDPFDAAAARQEVNILRGLLDSIGSKPALQPLM
jgi:hypothetical protein